MTDDELIQTLLGHAVGHLLSMLEANGVCVEVENSDKRYGVFLLDGLVTVEEMDDDEGLQDGILITVINEEKGEYLQ